MSPQPCCHIHQIWNKSLLSKVPSRWNFTIGGNHKWEDVPNPNPLIAFPHLWSILSLLATLPLLMLSGKGGGGSKKAPEIVCLRFHFWSVKVFLADRVFTRADRNALSFLLQLTKNKFGNYALTVFFVVGECWARNDLQRRNQTMWQLHNQARTKWPDQTG